MKRRWNATTGRTAMQLRLYNTLSRTVEPFAPLERSLPVKAKAAVFRGDLFGQARSFSHCALAEPMKLE